MPAFTFLGKKVNISLAYNTLTIYDHSPEGWLSLEPDAFNHIGSEPTIIYQDTPGHVDFHEDGFNRESPHYHKQFDYNIDETVFSKILTILMDLGALNQEEQQNCLNAYHIASHDAEETFMNYLNEIHSKAQDFSEKAKTNPRKYLNVANATQQVYTTLQENAALYFKNKKTSQSYKRFKNNCLTVIELAQESLDDRLEFKNIFANLAAAILGLGVIYLVAASINLYQTQGKHFFFKIYQTSFEEQLLPVLHDLSKSNILPI